jgi:Ca2+-binding EF-hand superfamily protein
MGQGLSKNDMDFLKKSTIYDEDTINQLYHDFKSGCPNGKMKPKTFIRIYSKCFPDGNAQKFSDRAFRTFDMDNNGHLDFKEFLLALDFVSSEEPEEKLKWAFRYTHLNFPPFRD